MSIIPRTLGVAEIMSVKVRDIITAHELEQLVHTGPESYSINCYIDSCSMQNDFPLEYFCIAMNTSDNTAQLIGLGRPVADGAIPLISVYYTSAKPDYTQWEINALEQLQAVVGEYNRILRHIRALEKGPENDLPVQGE